MGAFLLLLTSCQPSPPPTRTILFLSHTFQYGTPGNEIDRRLHRLDISAYNEVWLGGDLCSETTYDPATLDSLDAQFDLSNENTHWTLGNHDLRNGHPEWIEAKTGRPSFYSHTSFGLTRVVLNTCLLNPQVPQNPSDSAEATDQWELLTAITDTIEHSSHLILLLHHVVFGEVNWEMNTSGSANSDQKTYSFRPDSTTTFADSLFPRLVKVQQRGVQVLVLAGDFGQKTKSFYWPTDEGVQFLGCGINNSVQNIELPGYVSNTAPDRVLVWEHNLVTRQLTWSFPTLKSLLENE